MKNLLRKLLHTLGLDIIRHQKPIISKRSERLQEHLTATGKYYLPTDAAGDIIATSIKNDEIFDEDIYKIAQQYIKENTIALDVGSNFGQMAILMAKHVGSQGCVHAFEADDFIFEILNKNIAANQSRVTPHKGAVYNKAGETLFFPLQDFERFQTYGSYGIDYQNGRGRPVQTLCIDDIEFNLPVTFMKVDVQGGDLFAMQGATQTINRFRMPILFEYEWLFEEEQKLCFQDYVDFVKSINYKFVRVIQGQNYLIVPAEGEFNVY